MDDSRIWYRISFISRGETRIEDGIIIECFKDNHSSELSLTWCIQN